MATKTLQIRDLDEGVLDILKARAAAARMSLSAYVAQALSELAAGPTNAEVLARAGELAQAGGGAEDDDILAVIRAGRER
ncbi:hypothetical protein JQS43_18525 [Natronosporangium hydrolyticum]|uniref:Antitoxin FitA-like ribbon-helix-helix domain-containing protein n=1 Tax=Natronosporangium hydrolyticum TaxID=2811111 RepID=A0A895YDU4_9ACTN|nr:hypothetical protein [Natronosporangium hydrolyticum]QSB13569.1 hypothetical protein JQS43_18525 [Natronosporangium hydrolyticum]